MAGPCAGLTVLDFSQGQTGSVATLVLADYGADVIKVEPPGGDPYRFQPGWIAWNRGKKGIVLDLTKPEGRQEAAQLAAHADVVVESGRPDDMKAFGLDFDTLSKANPRLVYCSISGWGQKGPLRRWKGYEGIVAAKGGRMQNLIGQTNRDGPVYSAVLTASWHASQAAVRGIIAALRVRDICGKGQWVQTSIAQALSAPQDNNAGGGGLVARQLRKLDPVRFPGNPGGRGLSSIGYIPVRTKDGKWINHGNQRVPHVQSHIKAIGLGHLLEDPRFAKVPAITVENRELLRREILAAQLTKTADEWIDIYIKDGNIAAEIYRDNVQALNHPALVANDGVAEVDDPRVGKMKMFGLLTQLKQSPGKRGGPAPTVGQHTAEVLATLKNAPATNGKAPAATGKVPKHLLEGVTILDLATVQAGPYGATLLADLGARVIKVDATDEMVDENRRSTARELAEPRTYAGKEAMQLNLQTPEGKEIIHKMIAKADVLLHNFRLGVPERLQVDFETCKKINPRIVHVWMATYGEKGPYARRPGAHPIPGAAMGGARRQMGRAMPPPPDAKLDMDELVEATRWIMKSNWGPDQNTSGAVATAIMLGLRARDMTGQAQEVTQTMTEANAWTNANEFFDWAGRPPIEIPDEEIYGLNALYRLYPCADGWVFLGILFDDEWAAFCKTAEREDLLKDPRFKTRADRAKNDEALISELSGVFVMKTAPEWEEIMTKADVGCVQADEMVEGDFYADHPQAKANAFSVEVEHPHIGKYLRFGTLVEASLTPSNIRTSVQIGQHTKDILREFGYTDQQIDDYGKKGIVAWYVEPAARAAAR